MSGPELALEGALLAALAANEAVRESLGDPLRVAGLDSPQPSYPFLEIVRRQSQPFDAAGYEAFVITIDMAVVMREEGGGIAQATMTKVRETMRQAELEMEGWRCVVLTPVFSDTVRQAIGRWRGILRVRATIEVVG